MNTVRRTLSIILGTAAMLLIPVVAAQSAPVHIDVTEAVLDLGALTKVPAISSELGDPPATFDGDLEGDDLAVPKAGFYFPPKDADLGGGMIATINMYANEDITGTYDATSGELALNMNLKATVEVLGGTCVISPLEFSLSTENGKPYVGERFEGGIEQPGAVSASWTKLPPVTGGGMCGTVGGLIAGPGGIWMSQDIKEPKTCADKPSHPGCDASVQPPEVAPNITEGPGSSTDSTDATFKFTKGSSETSDVKGFKCALDGSEFAACDSGSIDYTALAIGDHTFSVKATNDNGEGPTADYNWTITPKVTPPQPKKPKLANLKIKPKKRAVKRGKKAVIKVKVKNNGAGKATGVKVCVKAPKKLVKVKKCVKLGQIGAKKAKTAKFKVTVKRKAKRGKKATLKFKATAKGTGAKNGKAVVKIK